MIRVPRVMIIDAEGANCGVMDTARALSIAREAELDLIEVSPLANPPVCKIMELGQWQYQQSQKKKQKILDTKVIRISFKIGEHDRRIRLEQAKKFIEKGHKVRVEMRLRGRERAFPNQGREMVTKFIDQLSLSLSLEQPTSQQGNTISALIAKKS